MQDQFPNQYYNQMSNQFMQNQFMPNQFNQQFNRQMATLQNSQQQFNQQFDNRMMQNQFDFILVNSFEEIEQFKMDRNQRVWFMLENEPVIAAKISDNVGLTKIRSFKIFEFDYKQEKQKIAEASQLNNEKNAASNIDEIMNTLRSEIDEKFIKLKSDIENNVLELLDKKGEVNTNG